MKKTLETDRLKFLFLAATLFVSSLFVAGCSSGKTGRGGQIECRSDAENLSVKTKKPLDKSALLTVLAQIAADNADGFTVDAVTLEPVTKGYAVSLAATQNSFGAEGLARVVDYVTAHDDVNAYGGWLNTDNDQYYYDATVVCDTHEEAEALARLNGQMAYFDLENKEEIRL